MTASPKRTMEREPLRRRRPALSCVGCRRRKIKCDRTDPCAHCVSTNSQCVYKVAYGNEPVIPQPPQQCSSLDYVPSPLVPIADPPEPRADLDTQHILQRVQMLEQSLTDRDILVRQSELRGSPIILNKTRILRWSHWMGTGQEVLSAVM